MREMLEGTVLPELRALAPERTIASRLVRVVGLPEAGVAETLEDLFEGSANPTVAYLASVGEVRVRITARAETHEAAMKLIAPVEAEVRRRLGTAVFGVDDDILEAVVGGMLRERGLRLACAESLTGGRLGARLTAIPGASRWFAGSVSEEAAREMARGARRAYGADVGAALTGVAGPDAREGKEPGLVWAAVISDRHERARRIVAPGDREGIRRWAVQTGLILLRDVLLEE
jgi:nicotinamide-nucleotide amidase